jgi:hypothetical protein
MSGASLGHLADFTPVDADLFERHSKFARSALPSSLPLWARPQVQAKIEMIELIEVS